MKIQRINDERLIITNLKNIRTVFAFQTLGIMSILGSNFVTNGIDGIKANPLWIVFVASTIVLAFLSITTDERLALKNLQKIRIAYAVQMLGIVGILGYDFIASGWDGMKESPLWFVFIVSGTILAFLSMNVSVDHEDDAISAKKGLTISLIALVLTSIIIGISTSFSEGFTVIDGILAGVIFSICGLVPFLFLFYSRKRKGDES